MADEEQVRAFLRDLCDAAGTQRQWARMNGFSDAYVSDVLSGRRNVSDEMAKALGYERIISFKRAAHTAGSGTPAVVHLERTLQDRRGKLSEGK